MKKDNETFEPLFEGNVEELNLINLTTHSGLCHTDDVATGGLLSLMGHSQGKKVVFTRTRAITQEIIEAGIVFDVGGTALDHHAPMVEVIESGRPLSSLGKTWRFYKTEILSILGIDEPGWKEIDKSFICSIDATDNSGVMNPLSYMVNCMRGDLIARYQASGSNLEEANDQAYLDLVLFFEQDVWPSLISSAQRAAAEREKFRALPTLELGGKTFKFSESGWVDSRGLSQEEMLDGFVWSEKPGQWKIRPYGWQLRNDVQFPELVFVHRGRFVGEVKGDLSLLTKLFPEEEAE